jgi:transmembrane sensor
MTTPENEDDIKAAARDWLVRLSLGSPSAQDRALFEAWLARDPRHAAAYRRFESIWHDTATLEELKPLAALTSPHRVSVSAKPLRWAMVVSLLVVITSIGLYTVRTPVQYATGVGEVRQLHLSDGSQLTLGARSSLEVAFHRRERHVTLNSGVAFFSVVKNPDCPFIVRVGDEEVRVVGTQFEIRRDTASVRVSVAEGTVAVTKVVRSATESGWPSAADEAESNPHRPNTVDNSNERVLRAGQQLTVTSTDAIPGPQNMPRGEPAAWRHGRLVYIDAPLRDVIADANRYSQARILLSGEELANVRVSVTYPSNRIEEMIVALSRSLSLTIEPASSGDIVLTTKKTD